MARIPEKLSLIYSFNLPYSFKRLTRYAVLAALLIPINAYSDVIYGKVYGLTKDNLTLGIYKNERSLTAIAAYQAGKDSYEYQLNLPPGEYVIKYNNINRKITNYPGTNQVSVDFRE